MSCSFTNSKQTAPLLGASRMRFKPTTICKEFLGPKQHSVRKGKDATLRAQKRWNAEPGRFVAGTSAAVQKMQGYGGDMQSPTKHVTPKFVHCRARFAAERTSATQLRLESRTTDMLFTFDIHNILRICMSAFLPVVGNRNVGTR